MIKRTQKIVPVVLCALIIVMSLPMGAFSADPAYVLSNSVYGDTVTVTVGAANAKGLQSGGFILSWDRDILSYNGFDGFRDVLIKAGAGDFNEENGMAPYFYRESQTEDSAELLRFEFTLVDPSWTGETTVTAEPDYSDPFELTSGSTIVVVEAEAPSEEPETEPVAPEPETEPVAPEPETEVPEPIEPAEVRITAPETVSVGSTFTASLVVKNAAALEFCEFSLGIDPNAVELTDVVSYADNESVFWEFNTEKRYGGFYYKERCGSDEVTIADFTFTVVAHSSYVTPIEISLKRFGGVSTLDNYGVRIEITEKAVDYTTFRFGGYPQTLVTDEATVEKLDALKKTWKSYGFYSTEEYNDYGGMLPDDSTSYCDVELGGERYRAVKIDSYRSAYTYSHASEWSNQQEANGYEVGKVYYFRFESLVWRMLDDGSGLAVCESVIDALPFSDFIYFHASAGKDKDGGSYFSVDEADDYYANTYSVSSIRRFLMNDFYYTAFSAAERAKIGFGELGALPGTDAVLCDKIFLLSSEQLTDESLGFYPDGQYDDAARRAKGTDYAQALGLGAISSGLAAYNGNSPYILRDAAYSSDTVRSVDGYGNIYRASTAQVAGIRPAFVIPTGAEDSVNPGGSAGETAPARETKTDEAGKVTVAFDSDAFAEGAEVSVDTPVIGEEIANVYVEHPTDEIFIADVSATGADGRKVLNRTPVEVTLVLPEGFSAEAVRVWLYSASGDSVGLEFTVSGGGISFICATIGVIALTDGSKPYEFPFMMGDGGLDGSVSAADARTALRAAVSLDLLNDRAALASDSDFDESVTPADARIILRSVVGLEDLRVPMAERTTAPSAGARRARAGTNWGTNPATGDM
ncbi:MAG: cohesin domain-containing protein [Clostridia bacterium]|nr:cohesin domain-containing protein [Clostridia bacterium]